MTNIRWMLALVLGLLSGCVSMNPMALDKKSTSLDLGSKSVVLMTFDVSRDDSRYVPLPIFINVKNLGAPRTTDPLHFRVNRKDDVLVASEGDDLYAIRMALEPGRYRLLSVGGSAAAFPFVGSFLVPLFMDFIVPAHAVTYVGQVKARLRPRQEGEFRAGPMIPLIDQAATGMSSGTFDVVVSDSSAEDIPHFRAMFPALGDTPVADVPLPAFDRPRVQRIRDASSALAPDEASDTP
ncbi:MAG: hypothetical protein ABIW82_08060 [Dokdonella sp.]